MIWMRGAVIVLGVLYWVMLVASALAWCRWDMDRDARGHRPWPAVVADYFTTTLFVLLWCSGVVVLTYAVPVGILIACTIGWD